MFDRHQAEITVMQFTGHPLPVHQSMSVPWEFFTSSHFISQFPPTPFPLITAIRMCHFLPVHHLGMAFLAGSTVKIQQIILLMNINGYALFLINTLETIVRCGNMLRSPHEKRLPAYRRWWGLYLVIKISILFLTSVTSHLETIS